MVRLSLIPRKRSAITCPQKDGYGSSIPHSLAKTARSESNFSVPFGVRAESCDALDWQVGSRHRQPDPIPFMQIISIFPLSGVDLSGESVGPLLPAVQT
jgi:hypothetical protein